MRLSLHTCLCAASLASLVVGQDIPGSFPHNYPGIPNTRGDFSNSVAWQKYYEVKDGLPNITFPLPRSFAGNIPVNRQGLNNTLFFWAFEKESGSLTSNNTNEPWGIWLNGGPGSSSLVGLFLENGPIHLNGDASAFKNPQSWDRALDMFWIDQPIGVGFSTSDADAFAKDEDQVADDFLGFLTNLVKIFPSLATRPLILSGESYAGVYIPYITKAYFSLKNPPVNLHRLAIGDGSYASDETDILPALVSVLETYPQIIGYDTEVFKYFEEQAHLCRLDVNFSYPQPTAIPPVILTVPLAQPGSGGSKRQRLDALKRLGRASSRESLAKRGLVPRNNEDARRMWKKDLSQRANGTIDPWYGCDLLDEAIDYAVNFTAPWKGNSDITGFDVYYIPDATDPEAPPTPDSPGIFLNDPRIATALHAPKKQWQFTFTPQFGYPFGGTSDGDPSIPPSTFFTEMAKNLSDHGIHWALYSGNADSLLPHRGTELVIQNISFTGGEQRGFTRKPGTPWNDSEGKFAGIVHQEFNFTYVLFDGSGHTVPQYAPVAALDFIKRFVLGDDNLGSVLPDGTVVGGEALAQDILPAVSAPIFFGSGATQGTHFYPAATIAAWNSFTATANAQATAAP